ncbi:hypothetical protein XPA_010754 [Xanthoria parietina]
MYYHIRSDDWGLQSRIMVLILWVGRGGTFLAVGIGARRKCFEEVLRLRISEPVEPG